MSTARTEIRIEALRQARDYTTNGEQFLELATEIERWITRTDLGTYPSDRRALAAILDLMTEADSIQVRYLPWKDGEGDGRPEQYEVVVRRDAKTTRYHVNCAEEPTVEPREWVFPDPADD